MLKEYIERQKAWSLKTFGSGKRTKGITEHIRKELVKIEEAPHDLTEWVDVIILGLDGAWRTGATTESIIERLENKQQINFLREYPFPTSEDEPSEHIR